MDAGLGGIAKPSPFTCPECHGVLLQVTEGKQVRYRCHTGHAYSLDSLLAALGDEIEGALWNAIRSLEGTALFLDALATHVREAHAGADPQRFMRRAAEARRDAAALRQIAGAREPLVGEAVNR